jgi:hypothetical protein
MNRNNELKPCRTGGLAVIVSHRTSKIFTGKSGGPVLNLSADLHDYASGTVDWF